MKLIDAFSKVSKVGVEKIDIVNRLSDAE